jgi:hypothetical protein
MRMQSWNLCVFNFISLASRQGKAKIDMGGGNKRRIERMEYTQRFILEKGVHGKQLFTCLNFD